MASGIGGAQRRGPRLRHTHHPFVALPVKESQTQNLVETLCSEAEARSVIVMAALLQWYSELKARVGSHPSPKSHASSELSAIFMNSSAEYSPGKRIKLHVRRSQAESQMEAMQKLQALALAQPRASLAHRRSKNPPNASLSLPLSRSLSFSRAGVPRTRVRSSEAAAKVPAVRHPSRFACRMRSANAQDRLRSEVRIDKGRRVDLEVDPLHLVPGDIIFLQAAVACKPPQVCGAWHGLSEAGDRIPADVRILHCTDGTEATGATAARGRGSPPISCLGRWTTRP